jgi:hypothetical protein
LVLYVDDLIITGNSNQLILWWKKELANEVDIKDIDFLHYFFRTKDWQVAGEVFYGQGRYTLEALKRFQMLDIKPMSTHMVPNLKLAGNEDSDLVDLTLYRKQIGLLMYIPELATTTVHA